MNGSRTGRRAGAAAAVACAVLLATGPAAVAAPPRSFGVGDLPPVPDGAILTSVVGLNGQVVDLLATVQDLSATSTAGGETVVTLRSDILFAFGKSTMPPSAASRIGTLVADVPRDAVVKVYGHTDSIGSDATNRTLSQARAEAVATAIRAARPDLRLDVRGFGETRPVAPNATAGKDDPQGRAKNRRVEIRY